MQPIRASGAAHHRIAPIACPGRALEAVLQVRSFWSHSYSRDLVSHSYFTRISVVGPVPPGFDSNYTFSASGVYQGDTSFAAVPVWITGLSIKKSVKLTIIGVVDNSDSTHFGLYIPRLHTVRQVSQPARAIFKALGRVLTPMRLKHKPITSRLRQDRTNVRCLWPSALHSSMMV